MNIIRDDVLIRRRSRIASITMIGSLLILAAGMLISFRFPEQYMISFGALIVGFLLSQIGISFSNRWGRRPRPDELLDQALKGLDSKYTLYHYSTPVSHLLVGPAGVWILLPYYQRGTITYSKGRWHQKGGGLLLGYLKIFAQEGLSRPDIEVASEVEAIQKYLSERLPEGQVPAIRAVLVFTNPRAVIDIPEDEEPTAETLPLAKLKELVRKSKGKGLSPEKAKMIQDAIGILPAKTTEEPAPEEEDK